jgi:hypothetical protein
MENERRRRVSTRISRLCARGGSIPNANTPASRLSQTAGGLAPRVVSVVVYVRAASRRTVQELLLPI